MRPLSFRLAATTANQRKPMTENDLAQAILDHIRKAGEGGLRKPDLRRLLDCSKGARLEAFRDAFQHLMENGRILRKRGGRYAAASEAGLVAGVLSVNINGGYGFVTPDSPATPGGGDLFVPPGQLGEAITGDRVLVRILETTERGTSATIERIVGHTRETVVGCLDEDGPDLYLRPMQRNLPDRILLLADEGAIEHVVLGDWILARLLPPGQTIDGPAAAFVRKVGTGADLRGDLDAVTVEFGLCDPYSADLEREAAELAPRPIEREDCRHLTVLTIDPEDAKDFDDGVSFATGPVPGRVTVGVHIADVAAFLAPDSKWDEAARARGFTTYLPDRTLPMLPRILAADRCSLIAGRDTPAHSVFLDIDEATGEVLASRRAHTLIRVRERLSFTQAQAVIGGGIDCPEPLTPTLAVLGSLARTAEAMRKHRRSTEEFLEAAVPEVRVICTENPPRILGLHRVEPNRAHELVEEFMLAANSAVARELHERNLPGLYRIHPPPKDDDLVQFAQWTKFVVRGKTPALHQRDQLNAFLATAARHPLGDVIMNAFLRTMSRASYSAGAAEHFGLGKDLYLHFTSPIRRYADLLVHQQLWAADTGGKPRTAEECAGIGEVCTALEQLCDNAYYAACDRLKLRHLRAIEERDPGTSHEGVVAKVAADGLLLYLPELGLQGFLPSSQFRGQTYRRDRDTMALHADGSGKSYKCGDFMQVQIRRADPVRGELILQPVQVSIRPAGGWPN